MVFTPSCLSSVQTLDSGVSHPARGSWPLSVAYVTPSRCLYSDILLYNVLLYLNFTIGQFATK